MMRFILRGPLGCFPRPESPDRHSDPIPSISALRGIIGCIYAHPGFNPEIKRIHVLNPIQFVRYGHTHRDGYVSQRRSQELGITRATNNPCKRTTIETYLRNPRWLIEFIWKRVDGVQVENGAQRRDRTPGMGPKCVGKLRPVDFAKATAIFMKRVERGEYYYPPMLGLHGFLASFHAPVGDEKPIQQSRDFGLMPFDIDYRTSPPTPHVYHAKMVDGVIEVPSFTETVLARKVA